MLTSTPSPGRYPINSAFTYVLSWLESYCFKSITPPDAYPVCPHPNLMSPGRLEMRDSLQGVRFRISQGTFLNMPIVTIRNFLPRMAQVLQIYLWSKTEWGTFGQGVLVCGKFKTEQNSSRLGGQELGLTFSPRRAHSRRKRTKELEKKCQPDL